MALKQLDGKEDWGSKFTNLYNRLTDTVNNLSAGTPAGTYSAGDGIDIDGSSVISVDIDYIYPVGIVITSSNSANPSTYFGGTWVAITGRVIVGLDSGQTEFDTLDETGGAKEHTLSAGEMPSHNHSVPGELSSTGGGALRILGGAGNSNVNTGSAGSGSAHNNLQPYIVKYIWERTA